MKLILVTNVGFVVKVFKTVPLIQKVCLKLPITVSEKITESC